MQTDIPDRITADPPFEPENDDMRELLEARLGALSQHA